MKSNYKRIGDYIRLVDNRNIGLRVTTLLGLTINKEFIASVANTVGTNMANYKIIKKGQFACSLMQVRRDKKIPVALQKDYEEAIVSQAYPVFEIIDTKLILPEYLMMWMCRSEFDREACFYAVGGVRGSLEWEDFCNMQLPVPDIEKQKAIVKEYNTIVNRIKLNEQLNKKLEETAQAIYKQWFVDFEFPYSPPLEGCPTGGVVPLEGWQAKPDGVVPLEGCPTGGVINSPSSENGVVPLEGCPTGGASSENGVVPFKRNTQNYLALPYNPKLKERAKALRKAGVLSEVLFWQQVHKRKFKGLDFDRQKIIGNYIVDFYCPNQNVVIEIDGSSHDNKQEYDAERDVYLKGLGLTVIRIKDIDVKKNLQGVMDRLGDHPAFQARSDHPARWAPLQRRGIGYKSSGGEMVWNEELGKEIPEGWRVKPFTKVVSLSGGGTPRTENDAYWNGDIPFFTPKDIASSYYSIRTEKHLTTDGLNNCSSKLYPKNTVFVTARGTVGAVAIAGADMAMNQSCYAILGDGKYSQYFVHQLTLFTIKKLKSEAVGAVFNALVTKDFEEQYVVLPEIETVTLFGNQAQNIYDVILENEEEKKLNNILKNLLLSKMTKG